MSNPQFSIPYSEVHFAGEVQSGMSSIIKRFISNEFSLDYSPNIGCNLHVKEVFIKNQKVNLKLWDISGENWYVSLIWNLYTQYDIFVVVFSKSNRESFDKVNDYVNELKNDVNNQVVTFLIGNKADLELDSVVTMDEGREKALELGMEYLETSALDGCIIDLLFRIIINVIAEKDLIRGK